MIRTVDELEKNFQELSKMARGYRMRILVCGGTGCIANGSLEIYKKFKEVLRQKGLYTDLELIQEGREGTGVAASGCHGFCEMGPLVRIEPNGFLYVKVKAEDVEDIVESTVIKNEPVMRLLFCDPAEKKHFLREEEIPFYRRQTRLVLKNCGKIDPEDIRDYIACGGYRALAKVLTEMTPEQVCDEILKSKLRGRGGAGFPTGKKWQQVFSQDSDVKYVVCNGDEGDPGAFMDRSVMEGDPHRILEGMMIAGYATGAREGYIYVRAEYPLAVKRLQTAINQAREWGLLGKNILSSNFDFDIHINRGAGAFVCGEGSALTQSIEGFRGMPRPRPPRTVEKGLFGKPTVLNNVETFANVPSIILNGAEWFSSIGTPESPGTKIFALTGNINNTGLIEVPMGITLRQILFEVGGGIKSGKKFKAVQIGGPSGGCLTEEHLDLSMDFDSLEKAGAMIGSGGLVVMDEDACMVEVARFFMDFTQRESCGKCVPCREGTKRMLEILEKIVSGNGTVEDLELLNELAEVVKTGSLCGLGKTAPNPVLTTMKYFKEEYMAHVIDKRCPSKVCRGLARPVINREKCRGCGKCKRICPASAIEGEAKKPHEIDQNRCLRCLACIDACPFDAIREE
ncbi:MAG: NADH-quinone oxidoreductase subunit [Tepidanaerobacteraceae bacterium]|nr:NADH-quinone oxidoreductase subunit [Tepidanaerobacteraceae bacterium]